MGGKKGGADLRQRLARAFVQSEEQERPVGVLRYFGIGCSSSQRRGARVTAMSVTAMSVTAMSVTAMSCLDMRRTSRDRRTKAEARARCGGEVGWTR